MVFLLRLKNMFLNKLEVRQKYVKSTSTKPDKLYLELCSVNYIHVYQKSNMLIKKTKIQINTAMHHNDRTGFKKRN